MFIFDYNILVREIRSHPQNWFPVGAVPDGAGPKYLQVFILLVKVWKPVNILVQLHLEVSQLEIDFVDLAYGIMDISVVKKKHSYMMFHSTK